MHCEFSFYLDFFAVYFDFLVFLPERNIRG